MNKDAQTLIGIVSILLLAMLFGIWGIILSIKNAKYLQSRNFSCYTLRQNFSGAIMAIFVYSIFLFRAFWNIAVTPSHRLAMVLLYSLLLVPTGLALFIYVLWSRKWKLQVNDNIITVSGFMRNTFSISMDDRDICLKTLDAYYKGIKASWKNYSLCIKGEEVLCLKSSVLKREMFVEDMQRRGQVK